MESTTHSKDPQRVMNNAVYDDLPLTFIDEVESRLEDDLKATSLLENSAKNIEDSSFFVK